MPIHGSLHAAFLREKERRTKMKHTPNCGCILNKNCCLHSTTLDLLEACKAAIRTLESIERNQDIIVKMCQKIEPLSPVYQTFEGWKRQLEHSKQAVLKAEGGGEK